MIDECPLPRVKRTFGDRISHTFKLMSAFLQSGRSERQNLREIRVRFRPKPDVVGNEYLFSMQQLKGLLFGALQLLLRV